MRESFFVVVTISLVSMLMSFHFFRQVMSFHVYHVDELPSLVLLETAFFPAQGSHFLPIFKKRERERETRCLVNV